MLLYMPIFTFEPNTIPQEAKERLKEEFLERHTIFHNHLGNNVWAKWNEEFYDLYPGVSGWSQTYTDFVYSKYSPVCGVANAYKVGKNEVELRCSREEAGYIYGYSDKLNCYIHVDLKPIATRDLEEIVNNG